MTRFWKRNGEFTDVEAELRANRQSPSEDLVRRVHGHVGDAVRRPVQLRLGMAGVVSGAVLALAIALGGVDYPLDAGKSVVQFDTAGGKGQGNEKKNATSDQKDATNDQYGEKVTICHRPPGNPSNGQTIRVPAQAAEAHFRNHSEDSEGPC